MARLAAHYSQFLNQWAALVGIPVDRITTDIAAVANSTFNTAIQKMWDDAPWIEVSPYGEARFLGNRVSYPNNLAQTAYWLSNNTSNAIDTELLLSNPIGIAFDSSGNLYIACSGDGTISKITTDLVQTVFASGLTQPTMLAFDSSENLYVSNYDTGVINKITPAGAVSSFATGFSNPYGLAFDSSDNLYVANSGTGEISKVTPAVVITTYATGLSDPYGLAFDAGGYLYAANYSGLTVDKIDTGGVVTPLGLTFSNPVGLAFDDAGNLYVACSGDGTISRVTTTLVQTTFTTGLDDPYGIAFDANGTLYASNYNALSLFRITPNGGLTLTANAIQNPADGEITATKAMETATLGVHSVYQAVATFYPNTSYKVSFYARPNGRAWQRISVSDGSNIIRSAFFNTSTGQVGTTVGFSTVTMAQQPNGFWLCQATFTASASANTTGAYTLQLSNDGSTLVYTGSASKGAFFWGALVQQTSNTPVQDLVLSWDQLGEDSIDVVYNIWPCSPFANNYPSQFGYNITPQGIQVINGTPYQYVNYQNGVAQNNLYGAPPNNPIFVYYRKNCPQYTGDVFDATLTYAVDDQVYFTASDGYGDFYKCIVATTAGQSPTTTPASWQRITLFDTFLQYCIYQAFGDWLISDGQFDKAQSVYGIAEGKMMDAMDKNERQMDVMSPLKVSTHLTSRPAY